MKVSVIFRDDLQETYNSILGFTWDEEMGFSFTDPAYKLINLENDPIRVEISMEKGEDPTYANLIFDGGLKERHFNTKIEFQKVRFLGDGTIVIKDRNSAKMHLVDDLHRIVLKK